LVEHHLAKVDVASSSLVTRSSFRLEGAQSEGWSERAVALAKAEPPKRSKLRLADQAAFSETLSKNVSLAKICRTPLG
jgi:hypothetical protein